MALTPQPILCVLKSCSRILKDVSEDQDETSRVVVNPKETVQKLAVTSARSGPPGSCSSSSRSRHGCTRTAQAAPADRSPEEVDPPANTTRFMQPPWFPSVRCTSVSRVPTYAVVPTSQAELATHAGAGRAVVGAAAVLREPSVSHSAEGTALISRGSPAGG